MSTNTKGRERPGTVFTLGVLLSTLGATAVGMLCCGVPLLVVAGGALGAAGSVTGSPWMMAAAAGIAAVLIIRALRGNSARNAKPTNDCCALAGADPQSPGMPDLVRERVTGIPEQPHVSSGSVLTARDVRCCA